MISAFSYLYTSTKSSTDQYQEQRIQKREWRKTMMDQKGFGNGNGNGDGNGEKYESRRSVFGGERRRRTGRAASGWYGDVGVGVGVEGRDGGLGGGLDGDDRGRGRREKGRMSVLEDGGRREWGWKCKWKWK
ncbi:hypothetical protein SBOR_9516 [Sclerotinia borealis F-4128]|uniref:Uncharacterized protein n=1 Tax=Sclerotinia borealis (strain F-4128) TaxID=1432307 RepID=W9C699_SCLBF|nr:hypothetical protein SBOR_9516 [Sclerotinia borealis F-4128]